ncbi:DUF2802 domain-containing protein [Chitinimonas naiadis]
MNALFSSGWQWLTSLFLFLACLAYLVVLLRRAAQDRQSSRQLLERVETLEDQLHAVRRELAGLADSVQPQTPPPDEGETAYSQAIRLAKQGLDSSAVAAGCGISRGEAELIVALYRASQRP